MSDPKRGDIVRLNDGDVAVVTKVIRDNKGVARAVMVMDQMTINALNAGTLKTSKASWQTLIVEELERERAPVAAKRGKIRRKAA